MKCKSQSSRKKKSTRKEKQWVEAIKKKGSLMAQRVHFFFVPRSYFYMRKNRSNLVGSNGNVHE